MKMLIKPSVVIKAIGAGIAGKIGGYVTGKLAGGLVGMATRSGSGLLGSVIGKENMEKAKGVFDAKARNKSE